MGSDGLDDDHPALLVGVLVDGLGGVDERVVHLDHLAGDGGEELGDGLGRLDHAEGLALLHLVADLGELDVDHVAELVLGEVGDADQ